MYFFTADEHYHHNNILRYCGRPFYDIEEHDVEIIKRFNSVVSKDDTTIHAGDFTLKKGKDAYWYFNQLNGNHLCLRGSHDRWLPKSAPYIWEKMIEGTYVVCCHYPLLSWPHSCYGSIMLHGHSHGRIPPYRRRMDVGVDTNNFYPYSFDEIRVIMQSRPDNFNLVKR